MAPTKDISRIILTQNVDDNGNPTGGGGGGGGDASAANQVTGNNSLASIDTKLTGVATAANQTTLNTSIGATNETAAATDTSTSGLNGLFKRLLQRVTTVLASLGAPSDTSWSGTGDATHTAALKAIATAAMDTSPVAVLLRQDEYETVAASQTDQVLGATGATNDYLAGLLIVPASTSPGAVSIKDGSGGSAITVFTGGASSVSNLVSFFVPLGIRCTSAGWRVTTGANVSVVAVGDFT